MWLALTVERSAGQPYLFPHLRQAVEDSVEVARPLIDAVRQLNPSLRIVARATDDDEARLLREAGIDDTITAEQALGDQMARLIAVAAADGLHAPAASPAA